MIPDPAKQADHIPPGPPGETKNRALGMLGLAKKAGFLEIGDESVSVSAKRGKAQLILSASDASDGSKRRAAGYAEMCGAFYGEFMMDKAELSSVIGRGAPGIIAVTDVGLAAGIAARLAETEGKFSELAAILQEEADRANRRRREAAAHRRNIRTGKRRTRK